MSIFKIQWGEGPPASRFWHRWCHTIYIMNMP